MATDEEAPNSERAASEERQGASAAAQDTSAPPSPSKKAPGVFNFVRGIDLSGNDFSVSAVPDQLGSLHNLVWLRLNRSHIAELPQSLTKAPRLEELSVTRNNLRALPTGLSSAQELHTINARHNKITCDGLPTALFSLSQLTTLDLSYNELTELPLEVSNARHLLVLSLAHNKLTSDPERLPPRLFANCTDLQYLDLGHNLLDSLPVQLRRVTQLDTLIVRCNPLATHNFLRPIFALHSLRVLDLCDTQRTPENLPESLSDLVLLEELDLSQNALGSSLPSSIFSLTRLTRLNLSGCGLTSLSPSIQLLALLRTLNLADNELTELPEEIGYLVELRRLFLNGNRLTGQGETFPVTMCTLSSLEVLNLSFNGLLELPIVVCDLTAMHTLRLSGNKLVTLPPTIWELTALTQLVTTNNPDLVMPPRAPSLRSDQTYGVDWRPSQHTGAPVAADPAAEAAAQARAAAAEKTKKRRVVGQLGSASAAQHTDQDAEMVLLGMRRVAGDDATTSNTNKHGSDSDRSDDDDDDDDDIGASLGDGSGIPGAPPRPKRWNERLRRPNIDYSDLFGDYDWEYDPESTSNNVYMWRIENFVPIEVDEAMHGHFYDADAYIVLRVFLDDKGVSAHEIYFWIGERASLDKKASAAIHAVSLRNHLLATCMAQREEQGDESDEFLRVFDNDLVYVKGGTESGFFAVQKTTYPTTLYRLFARTRDPVLSAVAITAESLSSRGAFLLDAGLTMFVWCGKQSPGTQRSKCRLLAEKINKTERQMRSTIHLVDEGDETPEFWATIGNERTPEMIAASESRVDAEDALPSRLYRVMLGKGYLELPQVTPPSGVLTQELLDKKGVYVLDTHIDVFVWVGQKSARILRAAGVKIAQELADMVQREEHASVLSVVDMAETVAFKSHFSGWDDVVGVDHTRAGVAPSLTVKQMQNRVKAEPPAPKEVMPLRSDLAALYRPPRVLSTDKEALVFAKQANRSLEKLESFVLEGKSFVRLPKEEFGHFYSGECYVFLCTYWVADEEDESTTGAEEDDEMEHGHIECTVYFWQGRMCAKMGWLTFKFSFLPAMEQLVEQNFGCGLTIMRQWQQRECELFLAHFKRRFVVHQGSRGAPRMNEKGDVEAVTLFQVGGLGDLNTVRCVETYEVTASLLCSRRCFLLRVPFDREGMLYVWLGKYATENERTIANQLGDMMTGKYSRQTVLEGEEPENFFWYGIGGQKEYDTRENVARPRVFLCSNATGFYRVSELDADFCQDDLVEDDCLLIDSGERVFVWIGASAPDVEAKLTERTGKAYIENLGEGATREGPIVVKAGNEPESLKKCFFAWDENGPRRMQLLV